MKKHIILILLLGISLEAFCQEKPEDVYIQNSGNPKFEGTYVFDDGQQRFVMTLTNKERVPVKKGSNFFADMLEGNISYTKNGKTIMTRTTGVSHIQGGMAQRDIPDVMTGNFVDSEHGQAGNVILTLHPPDDTAVFTLKKRPGGVHIVTDEASRQRAEQAMQSRNRPFAIPDSLLLKKQ